MPTRARIRRNTGYYGGGKGGSFSPTDISGLVAWYDFSDAATLFTDTGRTMPVAADADVIKGVTDKSGTANHLSEATNGPAYKVNIQNGKSVSRFDGTNDRLASTFAGTYIQPLTIFAVLNYTADAVGYAWDGITGVNRNAMGYGLVTAGSMELYGGVGSIGIVIGLPTAFQLWTCLYDGASSSFRQNSDAPVTSGNPGAQTSTGVRLSTDNSAAVFAPNDFSEWLLYDASVSAGDQTTIRAYLRAKWGTP